MIRGDHVMQITNIGILSVAKMAGVIYGLIGLIAGAFFTIFALSAPSSGGGVFGATAIILLPIFYAIGGFIGGALTAAIYNVVAPKIGGIEMEAHWFAQS